MVWQERRSAVRHTIELPIKYRVLHQPKESVKTISQTARLDRIKDISENGLLFLSAQNFPVGTSLELIFPVREKVFTMQGHVIHASRDVETKLYRTGIRFTKSDSIFKVKMAEQIHQIDEYRKVLSKEGGRIVSPQEAASRWIEQHSREFAAFYQ